MIMSFFYHNDFTCSECVKCYHCSVNCEQNTILSAPSVPTKWFTYSAAQVG